MTIINQVKSLVSHDVTGLDNEIIGWIKDGANHFLMRLPQDLQWQYSTKISVPEEGVSTGGDIVLGATKNGKRAVQHTPENIHALRDDCSIYAPTAFTPAYYLEDGKAYVEPDGGTVHVLKAPDIDEDTETLADKLPIQVDAIATYYAAMNVCTSLLSTDIQNLIPVLDDDDFNIILASPPTYNVASINSLIPSTTTGIGIAPVYVPPTLDALYADNIGTKWLNRYNDDDSEMSQEVITHIKTRLGQYSLDMQNQINAYNDDMAAWVKQVEVALDNTRQTNDVNLQKERLKVEAYSAEMQGYSTRINAYIGRWQTAIGGWNAKAQLIQARYQWLREQYMTNLSLINVPLK